jgi:hypothetical protein
MIFHQYIDVVIFDMQETQEDRDIVQQHYEPVLLYKESVRSKKEGFIHKALPKPNKVMDQQICHCVSVAVDLPGERVIVVDPLRKHLSHFTFPRHLEDAARFSIKVLADLLLNPRFPKHSSGNNKGWLQNCRMLFSQFDVDNNCLCHALTTCITVVNEKADMDDRWEECGKNHTFEILDSKVGRIEL